MRKSIVLLMIASLAFDIIAKANPVDVRTAQNVGTRFLAANTRVSLRGTNDLQLVATYTVERGNAAFYVFNAPGGFVIVSADDCAYPILGYSDEGRQFEPNNVPIQLQDVLREFVGQIQYAIENNIQADEQTARQWRLVETTGRLGNNRDNTQVGPLLTTTWDQGQYYNALCPEDPYGPDGHVYTGCVATAMAQIINYWGYPEHGYGTHSYIITDEDAQCLGITRFGDYDSLSVDYYNATYNNNNMPPELTELSSQEEINEVAQLMFHCGVAVNMQYGAYSSGAYDEDVRSALISNFGFSPTMGYSQKYMYASTAWTDSLKANIDRGEPVYYSGRGIMGGHAFVCDGYDQDDYFHFNFGWSGDCDGWYLTTAINAGFGFNDWQVAIMGIRPDSNPHTVICQRMYYFQNTENYTVEKPIDLYNLRGLSNYPAANELTGARIELNFVPEDSLGQLVLDVLGFDEDQSVVIYDGINKDSLVRVIETRGWGDYDCLPSDTVFRNMACTDFSPIVSTRHGFTVVAYGYGGQPEGFHLLVNDANDCRVVSDLNSSQEDNGVLVSWTENGDATQWQVMVGDNLYNCDETHLLLTELSPDDTYEVKVRAICDEQHVSSWNSIVVNEKIYWTDIVKTQPDGFVQDGDTIRITTAEGLAWLSIRCKDFDFLSASNLYFLSIENDIDLEGYLWEPIFNWYGDIEGHGHVISNMNIRNLNHGYSGLFSSLDGVKISGVGTRNCMVNATSSSGSIAGLLTYSQVSNCFSENHKIISDVFAGGLFGDVLYSEINNCYAYGNIYAPKGHGGLAGYTNNTSIYNSVSQLGESFNWCDIVAGNWRGLIAQSVNGGTFSNCFSEISNAKWYNTDPDTYRYYFLGNLNYADAIDNLAAFNISLDPMGMLFSDTAVNYTLDDNMDVVTALNNWVTNKNMPDYRIWIRDEITHMPVFGDYFEVTCPNVSNFTASNIPYNNGFAVSLSWQENGDAVEWQVKYNIVNAPEENAVVFTTYNIQNIIEGLSMGHEYIFYVRPVCGESYIGWGQPIKLYVDKALWTDIVTECPEGYLEDAEGNITISSAEGLAWLLAVAEQNNDFPDITISIVNDLDMGAYRWAPIWCFRGTIEGNHHTISNLACRGRGELVGFIGHAQNATIRNLNITNSEFSGNEQVGSFAGWGYYSTFNNCHAKNTTVIGYRYAGGFVGRTDGGEINNCSASGLVVGDVEPGGLLGGTQSATQVSNCYSNCNIHYLGQTSPDCRGGLIGSMCSSLTNSYSAGLIEYDITIDEYKGSATGFMYYDQYNEVEMHYVYAQELEGIPFIGRAFNIPEDNISDTSTFANNGVLNHSVTIADTSYSDLLSALNAWVDANNAEGQYLHWVADTAMVNGGFPMLEQLPITTTQTSCLTSGWNWWAPMVQTTVDDLEAALCGTLVQVKPQDDPLGENLAMGEMYRIQTSAPCNLTLTGIRLSSATVSITNGPNWFGYTGNEPVAIATVFDSTFGPTAGDKIISQDGGFAIYNGTAWEGTLTTLQPGHGYVYVSNASGTKTVVFE